MTKFITDQQKEILAKNAVDSSANFLNGQITNVFDTVMNNSAVQTLSNAAVTAGGLASIGESIYNMQYPKELQKVCEDIVLYSVQEVISNIINIATTECVQLAIPDTSYITQVTNEVFNTNKKSLSELISSISQSKEEQQKQEIEEADEKSKNEKFQKLKDMTSSVSDWINDNVQPVTDKINEIVNKYAFYDPDELENQIQNFVDKYKDKLLSELNEKLDTVKQFKKDMEHDIGEKAGNYLADQYNNALQKQANKQVNNINKVKAKAKQVAAAATQFAKLQIMALTGINIP